MASDTIDKTQLDIANQLLAAMDRLAEKAEGISSAFKSQSDVINDINQSFEDLNSKTEAYGDGLNNVNEALSEAYDTVERSIDQGGKFTNFVKDMQKGMDEMGSSVWLTNTAWGVITDPLKSAGSKLLEIAKRSKTLNKLGKGIKSIAKGWKDYSQAMSKANGRLEKWLVRLKAVSELTKYLMGGMTTLLKASVSSISGIVSGIVNVVKSAVGMVTKFLKLAITLPFQIAQAASSLGGKLRKELFEVVIQAGEETKQYFDQASDIGMGMKNLTDIAAGSLKSFQSVNSEETKLFGYGAQGAAKMIKETSENINAMGHFSEIFASSITKDSKNIKFLAKAQRALGLSSEDFGYLALDAASNSQGLQSTIAKTAETLSYVAKKSNVDFKRLSKNFFTLRKDIVNFGHLTNNELANLTAKMTQMGVKMQDAAAIFGKFSTFEDAANASAMLSQTFGMNVDAMKLIEAQNPGEIIDMFRHAMFETGRSFDDLNRHEKALMAQHTGMSAESLKMIMNFRRMGYTYAESKKMMEDSKPEARQLKAMKGLNSSITQMQKTMQFKSPFEAFFAGLSKALAYSPELRKVTQLLSGSYEGIFEFALNLKGEDFKGIISPIIEVVRVMKSAFGSKGFKSGLKSVLTGISDFVAGIAGYTTKKEAMGWSKAFNKSIKEASKDKKNKKALNALVPEYENIFKDTKYKSLLKKAGINEKQLKGLTLKSTSGILRRLEKVVDKNPEYRNAFSELGKSLTESSKGVSKRFKIEHADKKGILSIVNGFANSMENAIKQSGGSKSKVVELSGKMMGLIIKGGAMFGLALLKLINAGLKFADAHVKGNENPLLKWLKISKKEYNEIKKGYSDAFEDMFKESDNKKKSSPFMNVVGKFTNVIIKALRASISGVASFVTSAIMKIFGVSTETPFLSKMQGTASVSSISIPKGSNPSDIALPAAPDDVRTTFDSFKIAQIKELRKQRGGPESPDFNNLIAEAETYSGSEQAKAVFKAYQALHSGTSNDYSNIKPKGGGIMEISPLQRIEMLFEGILQTNGIASFNLDDKKIQLDRSSILDWAINNRNLDNPNLKELRTFITAPVETGGEYINNILKGILGDQEGSIYNLIKSRLLEATRYEKDGKSKYKNIGNLIPIAESIIKSFGYLLPEPKAKKKTKDGFGMNFGGFMPLDSTSMFRTGGSGSLGTTILGETYEIYDKSKELKSRVLNKRLVVDNGEEIGLTSEDAIAILEAFNDSIGSIEEVMEVDLVANLDTKKFMREMKKNIDILGDPHGAHVLRLSNSAFKSNSFGNETPTMDFDLTETVIG